jgi:hypothetical protein
MVRLSTAANPAPPVVDESERRRGKKMSRTRNSFDHDGVFGHQMELDDHMDGNGATNGSVRPTSSEWDNAMDTSEDPAILNTSNGNGNTASTSPKTEALPTSGVVTAGDVVSDMDLFTYGAALRTEFANDPRREVKRELENTLALMAYPNPRESALAELLEESNRGRLAEDLNGAILGMC